MMRAMRLRPFALPVGVAIAAHAFAARADEPAPSPPDNAVVTQESVPAPTPLPSSAVVAAPSPGEPAPAAVASPVPSATPAGPAAPFAWGDWTWMNGQSRQKDFPLKAFGDAVTLSLYLDVNYAYSLNHPRDNTLTGTASVPRHNEFDLNLASVGFDWNYRNAVGRLSLQYGSMISVVQDLDGTTARGRNMAVQNLRYIREATAGYHFDALHGVNVEGGIFMSYIGLESYLLAENWNYTRSVVCEHTPFYFQGVRAQIFTSDRVKIEPWLMNGWQTYGKWQVAPSTGVALRYNPTEAVGLAANFYVGTDTQSADTRVRFHNDHSAVVRYYDRKDAAFVSKAAFSLNNHVGFESGGKDPATGLALPGPAQAHVVGTSLVNRVWFARDRLAFAARGELFSNPSRYLSQYPPPGFETGPSVKALQIWAVTGTFDVMPNDVFTLRFEGSYHRANTPYYAGPHGTTSPSGFQPTPPDFVPDVRKDQGLLVVAANFRL